MGSCRSCPEEAELQGRAWWLFEEQGEWLGFSTEVSEALEAAYQHWAEEPEGGALKPLEKKPGHFVYDAALTRTWWDSGYEHGAWSPQAIRRISVEGSASRLCTRRELQGELEAARVEVEELRKQAASEAEAQRKRVGELEEENRELRKEVAELRAASARLLEGLSAVYPGRLVSLAASYEEIEQEAPVLTAGAPRRGDLGRVRSIEGGAAAVDFRPGQQPVWLPCECLELAREVELLSRPGSRVLLRPSADAAGPCRGVVAEPVDGVTARVLTEGGRRRPCHLQELLPESGACRGSLPLEVGDLVRAASGHDPSLGQHLGMVLARDNGNLCVRFQVGGDEAFKIFKSEDSYHVGCRDLWIPETELQRDEAADLVRPGVAVRFRDRDIEAAILPDSARRCAAPGQPAIGVVYATHADATAVVDFMGAFGCRCCVDLLEAAEHPSSADHSVLRVLSECLSWCEISAQHAEEREEALLRRFAQPPPHIV